MRRLSRIVRIFLTVTSSVLFLVVTGLSVKSFWRSDGVRLNREAADGAYWVTRSYDFSTGAGCFALGISRSWECPEAYGEERGRPVTELHFGGELHPLVEIHGLPANRFPIVSSYPFDYWHGFARLHEEKGVTPEGPICHAVQWDAVAVPGWALMLPTAVAPGMSLVRAGRRSRRRRAGRCVACGYDCRATPGRCPECGGRWGFEIGVSRGRRVSR